MRSKLQNYTATGSALNLRAKGCEVWLFEVKMFLLGSLVRFKPIRNEPWERFVFLPWFYFWAGLRFTWTPHNSSLRYFDFFCETFLTSRDLSTRTVNAEFGR
jgi:hypothetical protein